MIKAFKSTVLIHRNQLYKGQTNQLQGTNFKNFVMITPDFESDEKNHLAKAYC